MAIISNKLELFLPVQKLFLLETFYCPVDSEYFKELF